MEIIVDKVLLKKSDEAGKVPLPADLEYGELAINYTDGKLFYKNDLEEIVEISGSGGTGDGYTGSRGYTGSQGGLGYTGSAGIIGYTGSVGSTGFTGSASTVIGYTGSQGDVGPTGFTGSASNVIGYTGSTGFIGSRGYSGSLGFTGSQGIQGTIGFTGSASTVVGYTGSQGIVGITGYTGSKGDIGYHGSTGYTGSASTVIGYTGSRGDIGYTGSIGFTGSAGTPGANAWIRRTSSYTAVNNDRIIADTTSGTFTITLPATPTTGSNVTIVDGNNWATTNLTVGRNGSTIEGLTEDLVCNIAGVKIELVYDGTTWEVYAAAAPTGVEVSNDTTTNASMFPVWVQNTSGINPTKVTSTKLYFNPSTGTLNSTDYNSLSDRNLKDNIQLLNNMTNMIDDIESVQFTWKDTGALSFGVIAQDIEKIFPNIVSTNEQGIKSVSYTQLVPVLLSAVKELNREVKMIKEKYGDLN